MASGGRNGRGYTRIEPLRGDVIVFGNSNFTYFCSTAL
jgi:hypothetical protein